MLPCKSAVLVSPGAAGVKLALARRFVIRFILSPWCNVFPISLRCDAHSCSPGVASVWLCLCDSFVPRAGEGGGAQTERRLGTPGEVQVK